MFEYYAPVNFVQLSVLFYINIKLYSTISIPIVYVDNPKP